MISNCEGCRIEFEEGIRYLKQDYDVCFEGLGERKHLFLAIFDKKHLDTLERFILKRFKETYKKFFEMYLKYI